MADRERRDELGRTAGDSGATAFGGDVDQRAGGDLAGRDLTRIDQQTVNNIAQQVISQAPAVREAIRQLPGDVSDFTDREDVIAQIRARLGVDGSSGEVRSRVALNGAPGVGKSALAVRVAHTVSGAFSDAQLYVNLRGVEGGKPLEPAEALESFLRALGVEQVPAALGEREAWYRSLLADRRALVVLDNARDEAQVRPLLPGGAGCAVLVTSRTALVGLEGCWSCELHELDRDASVELLGKLIGLERIQHEHADAERIAELCGDLPLAVRISGALLAKRPGWELGRLIAELADEHTRLAQLAVGGLSVRASFDVAYNELADVQQRLFRRLAALPGHDFTALVAAELIGGDVQETGVLLEQLLDAQLIESPTAGRFTLHDLLRLYARERLDEEETADDRDAARRAAITAYLGLAQASEQALVPDAGETTDVEYRRAIVDFVDAETDNLVAAAHDAFALEDWETTVTFAHALYNVFELRSRWQPWERVTRLGLRAAEQADDRRAQANMASVLGACLKQQGRWQEAIDAFLQSLTIYREFEDRRGEARTLSNLGTVYQDQSRWEEAIDAYQQSLTIFREFGERRGEGMSLNNLGTVYQEQGHWEEAIETFQQSLTIKRELGDRRGEGQTLGNLGTAYQGQGQDHWEEAIDAFQQGLTIFREFGDRRNEGMALSNLGIVYGQQGRDEEAIDAFQQDLAICREFGDRRGEGMTLNNLAMVYQDQGRWEEAIDAYQEDLAICREFGDRRGEGQTLGNLGTVYQGQGHWEEAIDAYQQSLTIFREFGDRRREGQTLGNLGMGYERQGRWEEAIDAYQEDLAICREFGDRRGEGQALGNLGTVYQGQGRWEEAIDAYQHSLTICREFGDRRGEGRTLGNLSAVYRAQGRREEAIDALERSEAAFADGEDRDAVRTARAALEALTAPAPAALHRQRRWWPFGKRR